jgi:flagellar FliL protein
MSDKDADKGKAKADTAEGKEGEESAEGQKSKRKFALPIPKIPLSRKTLMFVVAPAILGVALLVGAYVFLFSGEEPAAVAEGGHGEHGAPAAGEGEHAAAEAHHPTFFEVPDILVNISAGSDKPAFLKLAVSLELDGDEESAKAAIEPVMPRVVDQLQTYLRELRVEDLSGSAGMFRLKEELLRRVNLAVDPVKVKDILFREMIVQ